MFTPQSKVEKVTSAPVQHFTEGSNKPAEGDGKMIGMLMIEMPRNRKVQIDNKQKQEMKLRAMVEQQKVFGEGIMINGGNETRTSQV